MNLRPSSVFSSNSAAIVRCCFVIMLVLLLHKSDAQSPKTDPSEVRALNSLFQQWDVQIPRGLWNISGEPCSGTALGPDFDSDYNNPSIQCNCTYDNNNTCHITKLKVSGLNRQGMLTEDLAALSYLLVLKLDQNAFTGTLPPWIGNLSGMVVLSLAHNAFYGAIPKEIGQLSELAMLALSSNNFSGALPPELGNLVNMQQLYLDSCGAGGEIPSTFGNLQNLVVMWAFDSPFTGKIPGFIGNWTKLQLLRLQGNNFEGPIPSSFSNLTALTSLRISDLQNVSSSLDFIRNLRNLTDLVLRNAFISGSIPNDLTGLQNLQTLDLSFNNLTGQLPYTLMNLTSLTSLFLGNNSLSGPLLPNKSNRLQNIDLSYNKFSGRFPSWVVPTWSMPNLQLNLVANNFKFDSTNISIFPGLVCLQRDFPCNRNTTPYVNVAIKCGGPETRSRNGILYEAENSTALGPASYYAVGEKWAVSNGGIVIDRADPTFIATTREQVVNTNTPELFQTARISPSSLRYYGLGLKNGTYTISLLFAETVFNRSKLTWQGRGRRVFDIFIQGVLQQKDFDISKEAGGVDRALIKNFKATVTQSYLEIHLFWAGKGTCCIPEQGSYGPLISALSIAPDFAVPGNSKSKTGMIVGIVVAVAIFSLFLLAVALYLKRTGANHDSEDAFLGLGPKVNTYSYAELRTATRNFSSSNLLGEGGFGPVYKGILNDGSVIAVKKLSVASSHGKSQFISEVSTISAVQHWNLVKLYGCCIDRNRRLLVYEYLDNKSLDQSLFGKNDLRLDWSARFNICLGTARGLAYLHEESRPRIVHRDVKASNILLDAELCPKISDFGLAKLYDDKKTHISTRVAGTIGYLAPEYAMRGHLTAKVDVFGYGVVCLEILSGRPNYDDNLDPAEKFLLERAWTLYESNQSLELVDPTLMAFDEQQATRVLGVALLCVQASPALRPPMSRVVAMLSGDIEVSPVTTKPSYLTDMDFSDITSSSYFDEPTTASQTSTAVAYSSASPLELSEIFEKETLSEER